MVECWALLIEYVALLIEHRALLRECSALLREHRLSCARGKKKKKSDSRKRDARCTDVFKYYMCYRI